MNYRKAKVGDKEKLFDLIVEFEEDETRYVDGKITEEYVNQLKQSVDGDIEVGNYFLVESGLDLVGFCLIEKDSRNSKLARIVKLFVQEKFRARGIGSKFLEFVENELEKEGFEKIWLLAHVKNSANEFYKKRNYLVSEHEWIKYEKVL